MSLSKHYPIAKIKAVIFTRWEDKKQIQHHISSKLDAKVLVALHQAKQGGINKSDLSIDHSFALSSAVYSLRDDYSLSIESRSLNHNGKVQTHYTLETPIEINDVFIEGGVS